MNKVLISAESANQWRKLHPKKHWKKGYSARTLAYCWQGADGLPSSVKTVFSQWGVEPFRELDVLLAIPEHKVPLCGGSRPSQNDIWVLGKGESDLVSIAVEGKVSEPFGPTLEEWRKDLTPGKEKRQRFICDLLELDVQLPGSIRYQLLHRTASAILEARRFNAEHAMMLVHSFSSTNEWFDDYSKFLALFGKEAVPNTIISVGKKSDISLYFAWVHGEERYLKM